MDGFRDRMNRGSSERGSYDRYERSSRRSSYASASMPPSAGITPEEVAQIVDEGNAKQLDVINDLFEDAKDDRFESEKQIIAAIDDVLAGIKDAASAKDEVIAEIKGLAEKQDNQAPVVSSDSDSEISNEILRSVNSNGDMLAQFAEEQIPMLIRGNSAILNQIRESLIENDEMIKELLRNSSSVPQNNAAAPMSSSLSEEVLSAATTNNALLNALRSDIAGIQSEIRSTNDRMSANSDEKNEPLDAEDAFTKAQADEMYKNMEDTIHGECVKVYRNVQKVLEDQNVAVSETVKNGVGGLKGLAIINLILLIFNLCALLARIFDFI